MTSLWPRSFCWPGTPQAGERRLKPSGLLVPSNYVCRGEDWQQFWWEMWEAWDHHGNRYMISRTATEPEWKTTPLPELGSINVNSTEEPENDS